METVGILGTGRLASFMVRGAAQAGAPIRFVLSPRGAAMAGSLAREFGCTVAPDNQAVLDSASRVILCLPPRDAPATAAGLRFRPEHSLLSVMARVTHATLAPPVAPARLHLAMMPGHANAYGLGPSLLHPADPLWRGFLTHLGPVHEIADPETFAVASLFAAFSGASFALIGELVGWFARHGLSKAEARALIAETLRGNAEVLLRDDAALADIADGVATPGGITEALLAGLQDRNALAAWGAALDLIGPTGPG